MDEKRTMVGPLWGQFVTHDIIQTPDVPDPRECACEGTDDICKAVEIPLDDPIFTDRDIAECMIIKRSAPHISSEGYNNSMLFISFEIHLQRFKCDAHKATVVSKF